MAETFEFDQALLLRGCTLLVFMRARCPRQLRLSNYGSATTLQQPRLSKHGSATKLGSRFSTLASTYKVTSCGSYENPTPFWQVHAQSHLTRHIKIPPPLASTCTVSSYTSNQNPTPSGKYMRSLILHVISKPHPLWQVYAQSHLTRHIKIPPPLASTCTVSSYTSYQNPTPSWQVHARSHLTRHIKIPPPLASTCKITSYGSYQNPTPSGKYMHSLILHVISKSHPLWQVHAQSHLTGHIKIPPPLASTCKVTSYTSYQNPTPSGKTCTVSSYTSYQNPTPSGKYMQSHILHVISKSHPCGKCMHSLILHVYGSWFTKHSLRAMVYESWFTNHGLRAMVYESWFTKHSLRAMVYESWFAKHSLRATGI